LLRLKGSEDGNSGVVQGEAAYRSETYPNVR